MTELAENNAVPAVEDTNVETTDAVEETTDAVEAPTTQADQNQTTEDQSEAPVGVTSESHASGVESTPAAESAPPASAPARDADGFSAAIPESGETARKHVPGGIGYEVIYVVRSGDQKLVDESSQRVRALIEDQCAGAVDNVRASEVRRFAYPIKKQAEGVYVVVNARFKPEYTGELDRFFKLDENVLRHMLLKEDN